MKKVFIFCESDPNKEPRIIRTIEALSGKYEITICGYNPYPNLRFFDLREFMERRSVIKFHFNYPAIIRKPISAILNLLYYKQSENILNPLLNIKNASSKLKQGQPNILICHGLGFLQLCASVKTEDRKLILNAHEYYPAEFEDSSEWKELGEKYKNVLSNYSGKIDLIFAVNKTIGLRYETEFKTPFVEIVNAPDYEENLKPNVTDNPIKIVHHGVVLANRKIELMIEAVLGSTIACELHLILVPTEKKTYELLKAKYGSNKKIIFSEPVDVKQISKHINQFDVGLFYLEPVNYNWLHALPNKLFEFIQARLAVVVSPNPDMKNLVEKFDLGWVVNDFTPDALVKTLNEISPEKIKNFKLNADKHSKELSSIKVKEKMLNSINQLCAA